MNLGKGAAHPVDGHFPKLVMHGFGQLLIR